MPILGVDFDAIIDLKSDNAYSGYFDTAKKNRIIREAIDKSINAKVFTNDNILPQDDLFGIYKTNVTYTPVSNAVSLIPGGSGIDDYFHMMNVQCMFVVPLQGNFIITAPTGTPILITLYKVSNLRSGERVVISGITGNTNANGTRYVKRLTDTRFQLYNDSKLTSPVASNGTYSGTSGTISRVINNYAKNLHSGRKFSRLNAPTYHNPFYEIALASVKIYPLDWTCSQITADYVSIPTYIDVSDSTIDLLATYSERYLYYIADKTVLLMGESSREDGEIINATNELSQP